MFTPDSVGIWLRNQAGPLAVVFASVLLLWIVLKLSAAHRRSTLRRERSGVSEESFVEQMELRNFDPLICATTYRYLQDVQGIHFPLLPSDLLDEDLGLDSEEVDQTLRELSASLRRRMLPGLRHEPLVTLEDLIRRLQASPRMLTAEKENAA